MSLHGHDTFMRTLLNYRVLYIGGRTGGGKSSLAFRLAIELVENWGFRYIFSNVKSMISDPLESARLRDLVKLDAVIILDEGGQFISTASEAKDWKIYLRKMNMVLIVPSAEEPTRGMRFFVAERQWNGMSIGIPVWYYWSSVKGIKRDYDMSFYWWKPQEVFGIYDTLGMNSEATDVQDQIKEYVIKASSELGYTETAERERHKKVRKTTAITGGSGITSGFPQGESSAIVEEIERATDSLDDVQAKIQKSISLLPKKYRRK